MKIIYCLGDARVSYYKECDEGYPVFHHKKKAFRMDETLSAKVLSQLRSRVPDEILGVIDETVEFKRSKVIAELSAA